MTLTLTCQDQGQPQRSSTAVMTVRVDELNDDAPHFERALYEGVVPEHSTRGTPVVTVAALLRRQDTEIQYSIAGTEYFELADPKNVSIIRLFNGVFFCLFCLSLY